MHNPNVKRARGILALLNDNNRTPLRFYPYDLEEQEFRLKNIQISRRRKRRYNNKSTTVENVDLEGSGSRQNKEDESEQQPLQQNHDDGRIIELFHDSDFSQKAEFTLLYFCDSNCRHSARFSPLLSQFVQTCSTQSSVRKKDDDDDEYMKDGPFHVICLPNDPFLREEEFLCKGMGFWCLSQAHGNRSMLIR